MNQDELAKVRALLPVPIGSGQTIKVSGDAAARRRKVVEMFPELLAHADAQATEISDLKAVIGSMADEIDSLSGLPDKVDRLTGQIEALKKSLVLHTAFDVAFGNRREFWEQLEEGFAMYCMTDARKQLAKDERLKKAGVTFGDM